MRVSLVVMRHQPIPAGEPAPDPSAPVLGRPLPGAPVGAMAPTGFLLDERGRPDFRDHFGGLCARATGLDVAIARIRLGGLDLQEGELAGVRRVRVVLAEVNAMRLAAEADAALSDPGKRQNVEVLRRLFESSRLELRAAPLAGWAPDFSVFSTTGGAEWVLVGLHWFQRPYPHPGPAFVSVHGGDAAVHAGVRFEELWLSAHDISPAIRGILDGAARREARSEGGLG